MNDFEYIIVGDVSDGTTCLVSPVGSDLVWAEKVLDRMLNNPTFNDEQLTKGHSNLRIKKLAKEKCWWNDPFLMSD